LKTGCAARSAHSWENEWVDGKEIKGKKEGLRWKSTSINQEGPIKRQSEEKERGTLTYGRPSGNAVECAWWKGVFWSSRGEGGGVTSAFRCGVNDTKAEKSVLPPLVVRLTFNLNGWKNSIVRMSA